MLGSDNESVQAFALFYFNKEIPDTTFYSTAHKESINVRELIEFVRKGGFVREKVKDLHDHESAIKELADGILLTSANISPEVMTLKEFIECTYLPFPCHTQFVEAGVKDAALVSQTGKEERMRSLIAGI